MKHMIYLNNTTKIILFIIILFIMPASAFATMAFDPDDTQLFNPADSDNIGYYLNNNFYNLLSQNNLILEHSWDRKFQNDSGSQTNVNAKIGLLSYSEFITYKPYLPLFTSMNWTRTPYLGYSDCVCSVKFNGDTLYYTKSSMLLSVFPTLYLKPGLLINDGEISQTSGTPLHNETIGSVIIFSGVEWKILDQMEDGSTYIILNTSTDYVSIPPISIDPPTGLIVSDISTSSALVSWNEVDNSTGYNVYLNGNLIANVNNIYFEINGLQPNTEYTVTVSTVKDDTEGNKCSPVSFITLNNIEPEEPIWTPLPGTGMGFQSDTGSVFDSLKLIFNFFKGAIWPFIAAFIALFTAFLLWKLWRRAAR